METMTALADLAQDNLQWLSMGLVFIGMLLVTVGAAVTFGRDEIARRFEAGSGDLPVGSISARRQGTTDNWGPAALGDIVAPKQERERLAVRRRLIHAGYRAPNAVFVYFLIRAGFGLLLPGLLMIATLGFALSLGSFRVQLPLLGISANSTLVLLALLVVAGYYLPPAVLGLRIRARQRAIREAFPNALDLMQVAVQAGLGFDAALAKIAEELSTAQPVLAEEFTTVILELRAGKPRDRVLQDLGERTGVEEITAFATVMNQSIAFGTSISDALETYAREMRHKRMMRAEELANQLPVKMSVVMVVFLLPTLFIIFLGPVFIRMIRVLLPLIKNFD